MVGRNDGKAGKYNKKRRKNQKETIVPLYVCRNTSVAVHFK
jgi:hypothetical protein